MANPNDSVASAGKVEESGDIDEFGRQAYADSALLLRQVGLRVLLSAGAAVLVWLVGRLVFIPVAEGVSVRLMGYPLTAIVSALIAVALAIIVLAVFVDIRKLSSGLAGVTVYHFGKATGELRSEEVSNYRTAFDGVFYVVIASLTYLLFFDYLALIHPAIPAVLLVVIVVWAVYALWRSTGAVANAIGRYTSRIADTLDKEAAETRKTGME